MELEEFFKCAHTKFKWLFRIEKSDLCAFQIKIRNRFGTLNSLNVYLIKVKHFPHQPLKLNLQYTFSDLAVLNHAKISILEVCVSIYN